MAWFNIAGFGVTGAADTVVSLVAVFGDVGGDALTLSAVSSDETLVTATLSGTDLTLDHLENQHGSATITVTASDPSNASVSDLRDGGGLSGYLLNDTTVSDDGVKDTLRGMKGIDWFIANQDDDKTDADLEEISTQIELDLVIGD